MARVTALRNLNESHRRIATLVRRYQPVTRVTLGRLTGLGSGPITQITRELLLSGLIREGERLRGGGRGQPAVPLMLEPLGAISFGVGMSPGQLRVVAIDFAGEVLAEAEVAQAGDAPMTTAVIIRDTIETLCRRLSLGRQDRERILGVGFALPGYFQADKARVRLVDEHSDWRNRPLSEMFESIIELPCCVENDATAAAIGEYYGQRALPKSLITLLINYGIGAGMMLDGKPFRGRNGNAGEVGAFFPLGRPRPSGSYLIQTLRSQGLGVETLDAIDLDNPVHAAACEPWVVQSAGQLRELVSSAWSWFDPELIILAGGVPKPLLDRLAEAISADRLFASDGDRPAPLLKCSQNGPGGAAIGAAHIPLHRFTGARTE
ncbi:N-acetylglucosamine repressor [compost metagenome]